MADFIGDRECITHHACECIMRKADQRDELAKALKDALELADEAMDYVDIYFREKWGMDNRLAQLREKLALADSLPADEGRAIARRER